MEYRTDPETGHVYAFGGLIGCRGLDDQRAERDDFARLLIRRAPELTHRRRRVTALERDAIEESIWGFDAMVRRRLGSSSVRSAAPAAPARPRSTPQRFQANTPAPSPQPASRPPRDGYRGRGNYVAIQSFTYQDPVLGLQKVTAGRTIVASDCFAFKVKPSAFAAA